MTADEARGIAAQRLRAAENLSEDLATTDTGSPARIKGLRAEREQQSIMAGNAALVALALENGPIVEAEVVHDVIPVGTDGYAVQS